MPWKASRSPRSRRQDEKRRGLVGARHASPLHRNIGASEPGGVNREKNPEDNMVSYFVRYRGSSSDPHAFHAYYEGQHAALLRQFPHIRSLVLHRPARATDPFPVRRGDTFL